MKVLVIRLGAMGDLAHLQPTLRKLKRMDPTGEIQLITRSAYFDYVQQWQLCSTIYPWETLLAELKQLNLGTLHSLRQAHFDLLLNLHPSIKTHALSVMLAAKQYSVYHKQKLAVFGAQQRSIERRHAVDDFYWPLQQAIQWPALTGEERYWQLLATYDGTSSGQQSLEGQLPTIALIPGVGQNRSNRAWPLSHWKALMQVLLAQTQASLVLLGSIAERECCDELVAHFPQYASRLRQTSHEALSIPQSIALLAQCQVAVGGDTGPLHLAAGAGIPVIGLYGPTAVCRTGPLSRIASVCTPPESLSCWPCEKAVCPLTEPEETLACMKQILPQDVLAQIRSQVPFLFDEVV